MKNLNSLKVFAIVIGVAIGTTACGGPKGAARNYCKAVEECRGKDFGGVYDDFGDCVDENLKEFEDYREDVGRECANAYVDFGYCFAAEYREDCEYFGAAADCDDLYEDYLDECY